MRLQELAGLMEPKGLHSWVQARACLQLELRFRALLSDGSPGLLAHTSPRNLTAGTQPQPEYPRAFPPSQETSKHLSPAPRKWCQGRSGTAQQHRIAQHTSRSPTSASNVQSTRTQVGRIWSCPVVGMQPACSGYCEAKSELRDSALRVFVSGSGLKPGSQIALLCVC